MIETLHMFLMLALLVQACVIYCLWGIVLKQGRIIREMCDLIHRTADQLENGR